MKIILMLVGILLLIAAGFYFIFPADQLPGFLPGHEAGVTHVHVKHGVVAGAAGIVLLIAGWFVGRR
ncbi:hypothetical protein [Bradyrhizobium sp.]|uniref:hypothetical protein n=1 Tax=Bradyrhizobium sp. TaxID=376 RepID=UPI00260490CC|nr:hypothetical protein [Bradyrhizobium sp.]